MTAYADMVPVHASGAVRGVTPFAASPDAVPVAPPGAVPLAHQLGDAITVTPGTMSRPSTLCAATKKDNYRCGAECLPDKPYCPAHDPAIQEKRAAKQAAKKNAAVEALKKAAELNLEV